MPPPAVHSSMTSLTSLTLLKCCSTYCHLCMLWSEAGPLTYKKRSQPPQFSQSVKLIQLILQALVLCGHGVGVSSKRFMWGKFHGNNTACLKHTGNPETMQALCLRPHTCTTWFQPNCSHCSHMKHYVNLLNLQMKCQMFTGS